MLLTFFFSFQKIIDLSNDVIHIIHRVRRRMETIKKGRCLQLWHHTDGNFYEEEAN